MQTEQLHAENKRLQRCVRDLVGIMALPAIWVGSGPSRIAESLLDSILAMLDLDFAYLHLNDASGNRLLDVTRSSQWAGTVASPQELEATLARCRLGRTKEWPHRLTVDGNDIAILPVRLGLLGEIGLLVAGSRRTDFPRQTEALLLNVAANQATIGLQAAWQLSEQKRVARELDRRVEARTRELAEANEELLQRKLDFQLVVDAIPAIVWSSLADGRADFVNQHFRRYVGLSTEEARDWGWVGAVHPGDVSEFMENWRAILASGRSGEFQARLRRFDGEYRWFLLRAEPLADADGNLKWFGACFDMHDWKKAQDELRDAQAELAHVARATTMGQLTASIAHEINQPLSGIVTNASTCLRMLSAGQPNVTGAQETARRMIRDARRATEVVSRLRSLFTKQNTSVEAVNLNSAIQEIIALTSTELQRACVHLRLELSDDLPPVDGDRTQLQQVIMNLILNAVEAMSGVTDHARDLTIATERDGDGYVRVVIRDAGVGFDPTASEKLFRPFHTTKSHGMGIGLSVSRSIVEHHHGRLWAEANDGPGATFFVAIPSGADGEAMARQSQK
ncbi:MAG: PAS domain-containing protein [Proteobacteria bacterium]|nr:PAS domain-containing protein [Pseudomonadota bacterium]